MREKSMDHDLLDCFIFCGFFSSENKRCCFPLPFDSALCQGKLLNTVVLRGAAQIARQFSPRPTMELLEREKEAVDASYASNKSWKSLEQPLQCIG